MRLTLAVVALATHVYGVCMYKYIPAILCTHIHVEGLESPKNEFSCGRTDFFLAAVLPPCGYFYFFLSSTIKLYVSMVFLLLLVCLCTDHWHWLGTAPRTGTGTWHWQTGTLTLAPRVLAVHARGTVPITLGHWVTCTCACQLVLVVRRWVLVLEQRSTQHAFVCVLLGCPAVTPLVCSAFF